MLLLLSIANVFWLTMSGSFFSIVNVVWLPNIMSEWVLRIIFLIEIICLILMVLGKKYCKL
jgi:hypothetical protein